MPLESLSAHIWQFKIGFCDEVTKEGGGGSKQTQLQNIGNRESPCPVWKATGVSQIACLVLCACFGCCWPLFSQIQLWMGSITWTCCKRTPSLQFLTSQTYCSNQGGRFCRFPTNGSFFVAFSLLFDAFFLHLSLCRFLSLLRKFCRFLVKIWAFCRFLKCSLIMTCFSCPCDDETPDTWPAIVHPEARRRVNTLALSPTPPLSHPLCLLPPRHDRSDLWWLRHM